MENKTTDTQRAEMDVLFNITRLGNVDVFMS
jgi:hypothetical protein